jgi:hypothetical protein
MDADDALRLDYEQTAAGLIAFAEVERVHRRSAESSRPARPSP